MTTTMATTLDDAKRRRDLFAAATKLRDEYPTYGARHRLALARERLGMGPMGSSIPEWSNGHPTGHETDAITLDDPVDGFAIRIAWSYDDDADTTYFGTIVGKDPRDPGAINVSNRIHRGEYWSVPHYWFVPEYTYDERVADNRARGMSRAVAADTARADIDRDFQTLQDIESYYVEVTASYDGLGLGRSVLGGFDYIWSRDSDVYTEVFDLVLGNGMIDEAVDEATAWLGDLAAAAAGRANETVEFRTNLDRAADIVDRVAKDPETSNENRTRLAVALSDMLKVIGRGLEPEEQHAG